MYADTLLSAAWIEFLAEVESARRELQCSNSAAWFRGHSEVSWSLRPSLFRYGTATDTEHPIVRDRLGRLNTARRRWRVTVDAKAVARKELTRDHANAAHQVAYRDAVTAEQHLKAEITALSAELLPLCAPVNGEREIFDEFVFRSGTADEKSSWIVLAKMRHFGVPTRLLDWTDRLDIAIYFALERHRTAMEKLPPSANLVHALAKSSRPCIWILNPFLLGQRATGRTAIWNLAHEVGYDYYIRVLRDRNWPFREPMPIYPPANFERLQSQRGFFTVFGMAKEDLDIQVREGSKCLRRIPMSTEAAVFCLDYLSRVQGLSPFEVYRDLDSLGRELTVRLRRIQLGTRLTVSA